MNNIVNIEKIKMYAKQLRLPSFNQYESIIRQLSTNEGYEDFLVKIMERELSARSIASQKRRIKNASFPSIKTLDEFDFNRLEYVSEGQIKELASCDFVKKKENIIMIGNPGSGKTHLSIGLGMNACNAGLNVKFTSAFNLVTSIAEAVSVNKINKIEKQLSKIDLLIIDELSYLTFNRYQSEMLFQVISERSEKGSVIINTNLEFSKWSEIFENSMMLTALIDRVTYNSHILNMNCTTSYRLDKSVKSEI